jgi:GPH family glycoside/pentoside/hexuronide:cation symporter
MLAYGCGDFAAVLYWSIATRFLPYFYTEIYGLSAGALGTMLLASRIWDGINDPMVGMWADRTETRWGKFRPFILFGCVPFAATAVLAFTTPASSDLVKLAWAYLTYNAFMMLCTIVNIPYTSLMGVLSGDPRERTRLASVKFTCAYTASLVVSAALLYMVGVLGAGRSPQFGWQASLAVFGVVATGFYLVAFFGTRERVKTRPEPHASILRDLRLLTSNKAWLVALATALVWSVASALRTSVTAHYFKYVVFAGSSTASPTLLGRAYSLDELVSAFFTASGVAALAGMVLGGFVAPKLGKKWFFIASYGAWNAFALAFFFVDPGRLDLLFALEIVGSFLGAPTAMLAWAMYADTADYGEWRWGRRTTALVFSVTALSMKIGDAFGAKIAFGLLDQAGFVANQAPTPAVEHALLGLMSIYPAVGGALAMAVFAFYPLTEKRMAAIASDLAARRSAAPGQPGAT